MADKSILTLSREGCCGCAACKAICPQSAISMKPDQDGFLYPVVDDARCTNCGLCRAVCESRATTLSAPLVVYAAVNRNLDVLKSSSSGGVFPALASLVFEKNGIIFGCAFDDEMNAQHIHIDNPDDLYRLQGSKYVQSDISNSYVEVRGYLTSGRQVLFTGTPCQIAGIRAYLGREFDNLITADIICHGVPSPAFFRGYISYLEGRLQGRITEFAFRDKSKGWANYTSKIIYTSNGILREEHVPWLMSYYYSYFLRGDTLRESCYECKYATGDRCGDLTMGDFWGLETANPEVDASNGASVLLVNSEKAMALVERLSETVALTESTFEKACLRNTQLYRPTARSSERQRIFLMWRQEGPEAVARAYERSLGLRVAMMRLKSLVPQPIKALIRKMLGTL